MAPLSVLLTGRVGLLEKRGGDTEQILQTARALHAAGLTARVATELEPDLTGVDLVHLFNLTRVMETAHHARRARARGIPCVLTPIYQDLGEYNRRGRFGVGRWASIFLGTRRLEQARVLYHLFREPRARAAARQQLMRGYEHCQRVAIESASATVFGSSLEKQAFESSFGSAPGSCVVPLGVSDHFRHARPEPFLRHFSSEGGESPARDLVICAGRIEDLKNQLGVLAALAESPVSLLFVGEPNSAHAAYVREFRRRVAARPRTRHLPGLPQPLLASAMASARVHVLASWFENVGLVSLEAAVAGCAVVTTARGYAREYLGEAARYCDPGDVSSISEAVQVALEEGTPAGLASRSAEQFDWRLSARLLARVYGDVVGMRLP